METVKENKRLDPEDLQVLLVEYDKAQDSAQHHDSNIWTITGIMWGGNLILLGFVLDNLTDASIKPIVTVIALLGIFLNAFVWHVAVLANSVMNQKYSRCKEIEKALGMTQHTNVVYPKGRQKLLYAIAMLAFFLIWFGVIWKTWMDPATSEATNAAPMIETK